MRNIAPYIEFSYEQTPRVANKMTITVFAFGFVSLVVQAPTREIVIRETSVSKIEIETADFLLNKGSTLTRKSFVVTDEASPIVIGNGAGATYSFVGQTPFLMLAGFFAPRREAKVRAVSFLCLVLDVFGEHIATLEDTLISDLPPTGVRPMAGTRWRISDRIMKVARSSVVMVDRVLLEDGTVWRSDRRFVAERLTKAGLGVTEQRLTPQLFGLF